MKRRRVAMGLPSLLLAIACPVQAKDSAPVRIGWLKVQGAGHTPGQLAAFREGMRKLGYEEGRTFTIESRFADGDETRLPALAQELVDRGVALILATSQPSIAAAWEVTRRIPIVGRMVDEPISNGMAMSLAKPGGNVTGIYSLTEELNPKRLDFLREISPGARRIGVLLREDWPSTARSWNTARSAASALGMTLSSFDVRTVEGFAPAFAAMAAQPVEGLLTFRNATVASYFEQIVTLANRHRLVAVYDASEFSRAGGLASYGPNIDAIYLGLAAHVDRLLRGTPAAELPIEQPTSFELILNRRTAREIGIAFTPSLLAHADEIID